MAKNNQYETYTDLDRLSTEQLEELLRADLDSPDQSNEAVIFHILEVIEQREKENPTGRLPVADQAWAEFKQFYDIPEGEGQSLYPVRDRREDAAPAAPMPKSRRPRKGLIVAAVLIALFAGMLTAQAAGFDIFSAIGRWTEETFHFTTASSQPEQKDIVALQEAAETCHLPSNLIPTWYPDGFEPSAPQIDSVENYIDSFSCLYVNDLDDTTYSVEIERYYNSNEFQSLTFEKDNSQVTLYQSKEQTFYIMSNLDTMTATWSDGTLVETISGQLEMDEITTIIDSIGG